MLKNYNSIFFSLLFMAIITLPSVLVIIDDSIDVSFFYDISEEEEEKGNEKNLEIEVLFYNSDAIPIVFSTQKKQGNLVYHFKNYPKPHLNLIFPPPEFIL